MGGKKIDAKIKVKRKVRMQRKVKKNKSACHQIVARDLCVRVCAHARLRRCDVQFVSCAHVYIECMFVHDAHDSICTHICYMYINMYKKKNFNI